MHGCFIKKNTSPSIHRNPCWYALISPARCPSSQPDHFWRWSESGSSGDAGGGGCGDGIACGAQSSVGRNGEPKEKWSTTTAAAAAMGSKLSTVAGSSKARRRRYSFLLDFYLVCRFGCCLYTHVP